MPLKTQPTNHQIISIHLYRGIKKNDFILKTNQVCILHNEQCDIFCLFFLCQYLSITSTNIISAPYLRSK